MFHFVPAVAQPLPALYSHFRFPYPHLTYSYPSVTGYPLVIGTVNWEAFKQKRNHVNRLKNRLENEYYNEVLQQQQNRPKQLWKTLKQLVPGKSGNVTSIKRVTLNDGSETTHPKEISNTFSSFFVSVSAKLASKFTSDTTKINPPVSRHEF